MPSYNGREHPKDENDNRSNQLNDSNDAFWESGGEEERPDDWEGRADEEDESD